MSTCSLDPLTRMPSLVGGGRVMSMELVPSSISTTVPNSEVLAMLGAEL